MSRVLIAGPADAQIDVIDIWWRANRTAAPSLFAEQLLEAFDLLEASPGAGTPYPHERVEGGRRLPLRTGHALDYVVRGDYVLLPTISHGDRGLRPRTLWRLALDTGRSSNDCSTETECSSARVHAGAAREDLAGRGQDGRVRGRSPALRTARHGGRR